VTDTEHLQGDLARLSPLERGREGVIQDARTVRGFANSFINNRDAWENGHGHPRSGSIVAGRRHWDFVVELPFLPFPPDVAFLGVGVSSKATSGYDFTSANCMRRGNNL